MPTYVFKDTESEEVFEKVMKMSELDEYMENNPTHQRHHDTVPAFGDIHRMGLHKKDGGFKEVLQKIHERAPASQLDKNSTYHNI